ncbi:putative alpha-1-antitrypsin-related protein [Liparis tanakae]|uniref:Putative alpha-1-antitrypsin-related protein n=1 Tax=Liparis tanakae TaxID=230148 RepID=A0A4Z2IQI4_9TELE|nr:putative alpha-1-antitrypsin-related protein [Liparis tanakae]
MPDFTTPSVYTTTEGTLDHHSLCHHLPLSRGMSACSALGFSSRELAAASRAGASDQRSLEMTSPDKCSSDSSPALWLHLGPLTHTSPRRQPVQESGAGVDEGLGREEEEEEETGSRVKEVRRAEIRFPKFQLRKTYSLERLLRSAGVTAVFSPSADFSGISQKTLKLTKAPHEVMLEVEETKSEDGGRPDIMLDFSVPTRITFNRPFLLIVYDDLTGLVLLMGRVTDPTAGCRPECVDRSV